MSLTLIETKTLGAAAASIEFTSIPQDGTDLVLLLAIRADNTPGVTGGDGLIFFNDSTTGYSGRQLAGNGSTAFSESSTTAGQYAGFEVGSGATANTFSNTSIYIPNYTGSTNKSFSVDTVNETNATLASQAIQASLWSNTSAITKITYSRQGGANLTTGSTISLYKVTKGSDGIVTTS